MSDALVPTPETLSPAPKKRGRRRFGDDNMGLVPETSMHWKLPPLSREDAVREGRISRWEAADEEGRAARLNDVSKASDPH